MTKIKIGWADADLTPTEPVLITGQLHARISEGVLDPITATALVLDNDNGKQVILVACDFCCIGESLVSAVRQQVTDQLPALHEMDIILNATHTHAGPEVRVAADTEAGLIRNGTGVELPVMSSERYVEFAASRISEAVVTAWQERATGSIGYGLGQAVIGRNRRSCYTDGMSRMYGNTSAEDFCHIEGYEDHDVNIMATWDANDTVTGLLLNVPCPAQVSEHIYQLSADFWCETRRELRQRLGEKLYVLPQCSAAGDLSPHIQYNTAAEARMRKIAERSEREEIAQRLANAVITVLPLIVQDKHTALAFGHRFETIQVTGRKLSEQDVDDAKAAAVPLRENYHSLLADLEAQPDKREEARWYVPITQCFLKMNWHLGVEKRYAQEQINSHLPKELHVIRIGDMVLATNPSEYYLDFGIMIKARSVATQTFISQLSGPGTYVPSERAVAGGSYGAGPASTPVGDVGGREMAEWTLKAIQELYAK